MHGPSFSGEAVSAVPLGEGREILGKYNHGIITTTGAWYYHGITTTLHGCCNLWPVNYREFPEWQGLVRARWSAGLWNLSRMWSFEMCTNQQCTQVIYYAAIA